MPEATSGDISNIIDLVLVGFDQNGSKKILNNLTSSKLIVQSCNKDQFVKSKVFLFDGTSLTVQEIANYFAGVAGERGRLPTIVFGKELSTDKISKLINQFGVHSFLSEEGEILSVVESALSVYDKRFEVRSTLNKAKVQNKKLEDLTDNLEQLVHQRTKSEFMASQQTEVSAKEMQSILLFVKAASRTSSIEDLMAVVRLEYKQVFGLMPPVLLLRGADGVEKILYFHGKQLIERPLAGLDVINKLKQNPETESRTLLSNIMARPVGQLAIRNFEFNSSSEQTNYASMIFEYGLGGAESELESFSEPRWPILTMALENILIGEGLTKVSRQWSKTFNEMKDPILIVDSHLGVSHSNGVFHENRDLSCYQAFAKRDSPCKGCPVGKTMQLGEPQHGDIHLEGRVYRVHSYPIKLDPNEDVSYVINQYVNVTKSVDLQSRVIQGEKMAAVGLLAGNIAHELNNPLTGIYSLAELLLDELEDQSNTYKDLCEIQQASARCQRIIKDLLDFTDVEKEAGTQPVDMNTVISKTLPLLKMALRTMNTDVELYNQALNVNCNPQLMQQVIFNLINNACQAMSESGILTVRTLKKNGFMTIAIRDTGPGIPENIRSSIFEPFFTTKEEGKGTGLGLSMSKSVVESFGGSLVLNESYTDGTEFVIELPLVT